MPTIVKDKLTVTASQARFLLEMETLRGGVLVDLDRCLDYQIYFTEASRAPLKRLKLLGGDSNLHSNNVEECKRLLVTRFGVSEHYMRNRAGGLSLDKDTIKQLLENPNVNEDAKEFITVYADISKNLYQVSYLEQYINNPLLEGLSYEGHRMVCARPTWKVLSTRRISASGPSVQNISKKVADIFTYPEGYMMLYSDSGQIEPRIQYSHFVKDPVIKELIRLYDDAYYGQMDYISLSEEDYAAAYKSLDNLKLHELTKADRQIIKRILLMGSYGSEMTDVDPILYGQFQRRIINNPFKKEFDDSVRDDVENGAEIFYSAFGTAIKPEETLKYKRGTPAWKNHLIRCGMNNPIQTTASDLMNESVKRATDILRTRASKSSFIGYYKHDEGLFYLAPGDHGLADELVDCMSYDVEMNGEKWLPIRSDKVVGKKPGTVEVPIY